MSPQRCNSGALRHVAVVAVCLCSYADGGRLGSDTGKPTQLNHKLVRATGALLQGKHGPYRRHSYINSLIYNPHPECFAKVKDYSWSPVRGWHNNYPQCKKNMAAFLDEMLASNSSRHVDFAGIVYTDDRYKPPKHMAKFKSKCSNSHGKDDVLLLYDRREWRPKGDLHRGCMGEGVDMDSRPFLIQGFRSMGTTPSASPLTLLVIAAHFPHPSFITGAFDGQEKLRKEVRAAKEALSVENVLLVADTNFADYMMWSSGSSIMQAIGVGEAYRTTALHYTCCYSEGASWSFRNRGFDRVISNFGRAMETTLPLKSHQVMSWGARNMHLPVLGSLELCDEPAALCSRAPPAGRLLAAALLAFAWAVVATS